MFVQNCKIPNQSACVYSSAVFKKTEKQDIKKQVKLKRAEMEKQYRDFFYKSIKSFLWMHSGSEKKKIKAFKERLTYTLEWVFLEAWLKGS